ncbi:triose-phosphate isomerase [Candidatus Micrarchaeota archaeon]|jgi:triosephosphate isomerase|nr:triose-phosphate isomerase [Candidatus Micrarchaeota archaeon]
MKKIIVLNLKTYSHDLKPIKDAVGFGNVYVAPPLPILSQAVKIHKNILAQHCEPAELGQFTGHIAPEMLKNMGVKGTLLNHSEKRLDFDVLKKTIDLCKKHKLLTIVCAKDPAEVAKISKLKPDYIAIEPPELIGSGISVSKAQPEIITNSIKKSKVPVLCGAGVSTEEDVRIASKLKAQGVLIASAYFKNKKRKEWLKEIVKSL